MKNNVLKINLKKMMKRKIKVEILGYIKNGVCLEDEFGVPMNSYVVSLFIQQVRDGNWDESITTLYCILVQ